MLPTKNVPVFDIDLEDLEDHVGNKSPVDIDSIYGPGSPT